MESSDPRMPAPAGAENAEAGCRSGGRRTAERGIWMPGMETGRQLDRAGGCGMDLVANEVLARIRTGLRLGLDGFGDSDRRLRGGVWRGKRLQRPQGWQRRGRGCSQSASQPSAGRGRDMCSRHRFVSGLSFAQPTRISMHGCAHPPPGAAWACLAVGSDCPSVDRSSLEFGSIHTYPLPLPYFQVCMHGESAPPSPSQSQTQSHAATPASGPKPGTTRLTCDSIDQIPDLGVTNPQQSPATKFHTAPHRAPRLPPRRRRRRRQRLHWPHRPPP